VIKVFESLIEAYPYYDKCPICKSALIYSAVDKDCWVNDYIYSLDHCTFNLPRPLRVTLNNGDSDNIVFDIKSEKIISMSITQSARYQPVYSIGSPGPAYIIKAPNNTNYDIRDGILMQGHRIDCNSCYQYAYTLQLRFDLKNMIVETAILNSEFVSIEEGDNVYEIRNVYTMNKTEYSHISNKKRHETLQLPLVSNNMSNPIEVLGRIKKLLIFS